MRGVFLSSLLLLTVTVAVHAQDEESQVTWAPMFTSQQVFRGVKLAGSSAVGRLDLAQGGWTGGFQFDQPFRTNEPGAANLEIGCAGKVSDHYKLSTGLRQHWLTNPPAGATKENTEGGLGLAWLPQDDLRIRADYWRDFRLQADTWEVSASYSQPLTQLGTYLEWNAYLGTSRACNVRPDAGGGRLEDNYVYYGADLRLPYRLPIWRATITAGLHAAGSSGQSPAWSPILARGASRVWTDLSASFEF